MPRIEHFGCKLPSVGRSYCSKSKKLHRPKSRAIRPMNSTALPDIISAGGEVKFKEAVRRDGLFSMTVMARGVWGMASGLRFYGPQLFCALTWPRFVATPAFKAGSALLYASLHHAEQAIPR
jgi:hypothetical protein